MNNKIKIDKQMKTEICHFWVGFFREEKNQFLEVVEEQLTEYGYESERKSFEKIVKSVNLETKCDKPEFIFTQVSHLSLTPKKSKR